MKRATVRLVAFVLIGAAMSIAGGWGCVLWRVFVAKPYLGASDGSTEPGTWPIEPPEGWPEPDSASVTRGLGYERLVTSGAACETPEGLRNYREVLLEWREHSLRARELATRELRERLRDGGEPALREYRPGMLTVAAPPPPGRMQSLYVFRRRSGWPFLCMQSSWTNLTDESGRTAVVDVFGHGWTTRMYWDRGIPWPRTVNAGHFNLPLRPVAWAFALNTAFWASFAWVVLRGIWLARRRAREWRGVCVACCYPVGVSEVCTECGRPVGTRATEAAA